MVTSARGIVPPGPCRAVARRIRRPPTGDEPASTTTWNDSNSFRAASRFAADAPAGCRPGRTVTSDPTTTTAGDPVPRPSSPDGAPGVGGPNVTGRARPRAFDACP